MWMNELKSLYFYPKISSCFNFKENTIFGVSPENRKLWENGRSTRIGADCLGEWSDG